jgi:glucose-1-phosphate cytidylyltransferase
MEFDDLMKVVILCGGLGMRLREETEFRPKPMIEIGGKPILWHIMKIYSHYGFKDFILPLGYKGDVIKNFFFNYKIMNCDFSINLHSGNISICSDANNEDWNLTLIDTGYSTMTGGRIKRIERYVDGDAFMVTYGDAVADINIPELLKLHRQKNKIATLTAVTSISRFGNMEIDSSQIVNSFKEKPLLADLVSGGFFVFLEQEPLETLSKRKQLVAYVHRGYWQCMDTYRDFTLLNSVWQSGNIPWKIW